MNRLLAGATSGALLGFMIPLAPIPKDQLVIPTPPELMPREPESTSRERSPIAQSKREANPRRLCVDLERLNDARTSALDAERTLAVEASSFTQDWGTPLEPPHDWNVNDAAQGLEQRLDALDVEYADVNCEHFPCMVLIASTLEPDVDILAMHFGVARARISSTTAGSGSNKVYLDTIAMVQNGELSEGESLWIRRLTNRQIAHTAGDIDRLLQAK